MMKVLELGAQTERPGFGLDLNVKHASTLQQTDKLGPLYPYHTLVWFYDINKQSTMIIQISALYKVIPCISIY